MKVRIMRLSKVSELFTINSSSEHCLLKSIIDALRIPFIGYGESSHISFTFNDAPVAMTRAMIPVRNISLMYWHDRARYNYAPRHRARHSRKHAPWVQPAAESRFVAPPLHAADDP
jgi:hypothetical protein